MSSSELFLFVLDGLQRNSGPSLAPKQVLEVYSKIAPAPVGTYIEMIRVGHTFIPNRRKKPRPGERIHHIV